MNWRNVFGRQSTIKVKSKKWQQQHTELWDMLVPKEGAANTVQGEVIRISGKVSREIYENGAINWDDQYELMLNTLPYYFHMGDGLDTDLMEEACMLAKHITPDSEYETMCRLAELIVKWVLANPVPIFLDSVPYQR